MKKLSEVSKIVGVTRRTLQEYEKIGLLKPTRKTEAGYWLYDDTAIITLILIQIFVECGYERKAIKSLLESHTLDMIEELNHLIANLEKKRQRINGMINIVRILKICPNLPESTLRALSNLDVTRVYKDKSFSSCLEDFIVWSAENSDAENDDTILFMTFVNNLIAIGCLFRTPEDAKHVQDTVGQAYRSMIEMIMAGEYKDFAKKLPEAELAEFFLDYTQDIVSEPEFQQMVNLQCGDGATEYIIRAVQLFCNKKTTESKTTQK